MVEFFAASFYFIFFLLQIFTKTANVLIAFLSILIQLHFIYLSLFLNVVRFCMNVQLA